jgi:peptide deformylase
MCVFKKIIGLMARLKIITGINNPILRKVSEPVQNFDNALKKFAKDLKSAMLKAKGLGIAAPQVGENIRVFLVTLDYGEKDQRFVAMANPEIVWHSEETYIDEEGCLSLPGDYGKVERWKEVRVDFTDLDGNRQVLELSMLNAREVQHELDHLNGVMFPDRMGVGEKIVDVVM